MLGGIHRISLESSHPLRTVHMLGCTPQLQDRFRCMFCSLHRYLQSNPYARRSTSMQCYCPKLSQCPTRPGCKARPWERALLHSHTPPSRQSGCDQRRIPHIFQSSPLCGGKISSTPCPRDQNPTSTRSAPCMSCTLHCSSYLAQQASLQACRRKVLVLVWVGRALVQA